MTNDEELLLIAEQIKINPDFDSKSASPKKNFREYILNRYNLHEFEGGSGINLKAKKDIKITSDTSEEDVDLETWLDENVKSIKGVIPENMESLFRAT